MAEGGSGSATWTGFSSGNRAASRGPRKAFLGEGSRSRVLAGPPERRTRREDARSASPRRQESEEGEKMLTEEDPAAGAADGKAEDLLQNGTHVLEMARRSKRSSMAGSGFVMGSRSATPGGRRAAGSRPVLDTLDRASFDKGWENVEYSMAASNDAETARQAKQGAPSTWSLGGRGRQDISLSSREVRTFRASPVYGWSSSSVRRSRVCCKRQRQESGCEPSDEQGLAGGDTILSGWHQKRLNDTVQVWMALGDHPPLMERLEVHLTPGEVKRLVLQAAEKRRGGAGMLDEADYVVKPCGFDFVLTREDFPIHRIKYVQMCKKSYVPVILEVVPKADLSEEIMSGTEPLSNFARELQLQAQIMQVVGADLASTYFGYENEAILSFRKSLTRERLNYYEERKALEREDNIYTVLPVYVGSEPLPLDIDAKQKIMQCHLPGSSNAVCTVAFSGEESAEALKLSVFRKLCRLEPKLKDDDPEDYVLKLTGLQEYLYGDRKVIDFDCIRKCLSKKQKIVLSLITKKELQKLFPVDMTAYELTISDIVFSKMPTPVDPRTRIDIYSLSDSVGLTVKGIRNIPPPLLGSGTTPSVLYLAAQLYHGGVPISKQSCTNCVVACANPRWNAYLVFGNIADEQFWEDAVTTTQEKEPVTGEKYLQYKNVPQGTRICYTLYRREVTDSMSLYQRGAESGSDVKDFPIAWVNESMVDHLNAVRTGEARSRMWMEGKADPIGTCTMNLSRPPAPVLHVDYKSFDGPVIFPDSDKDNFQLPSEDTAEILSQHGGYLDSILKKDPLDPLTPDEKKLLWRLRSHLVSFPEAIPKFLQSVLWHRSAHVREAHRLLKIWKRPSPTQAIELLDARYADPVVRRYAVKVLGELADGDLEDILLQFTQVLKYETHRDSPLACFLLRRALRNAKIGHIFFWNLRAEMHLPEISELYAILLEAFARGCGHKRAEVVKQNSILNDLVGVAMKIKVTKTEEKKKVLHEELEKLKFPPRFQLALDSRMEARGIRVPKCKYMDSKKLPLWLVFENVEDIGQPITVIFKVGDDLRQDCLTLQMIRLMDKIWKKNGLDLRLRPYGAVATGDEIGMIEVVLNSDTMANINKAAGGTTAVLIKDTVTNWLRRYNPTDAEFQKAQENFALSCAGYCVATYVLGIGDRHNDNIMCTREGHVFHIDFGHFLGNYKKKFGIKRERAPFVFTPQYANVLGGKKGKYFAEFVDFCCRAYNILRQHSDLFINLFQLMLCGGIPELRNARDIDHLREALAIGASDAQAAEIFTQLIHTSLKTKTTVVNDMIHIWAHS